MIKVHVLNCGSTVVDEALPLSSRSKNPLAYTGLFRGKKHKISVPVRAYLIEHSDALILVDTGWARDMSPRGEFDKKAQIKSLGSWVLYKVNQGRIPMGACIDEQLAKLGLKDSDLDAVLLKPAYRAQAVDRIAGEAAD